MLADAHCVYLGIGRRETSGSAGGRLQNFLGPDNHSSTPHNKQGTYENTIKSVLTDMRRLKQVLACMLDRRHIT